MSSRRSRWTLDLCVVITWQLVICAIVRASGFRAVSDDDYARVVIAAEFVNHPSWDPSGTSWLPFPFLLNGSTMVLFGDELSVARAVAVGCAVITSPLLYIAARILTGSRLWAVIAACAGISLAYSALLSVATVPEYLSAGCLVFAVSTLTRQDPQLRCCGALSVLIASASRYEAWPVAGIFVLITLHDAWKNRASGQGYAFLLSAALGVAFPFAWLIHGISHHENALFFVSRVVDYKRALGDELPSFAQLLGGTPRALLFAEPEPVLAALIACLFGLRWTANSGSRLFLWRAWLPLAAMVVTLIVGEARGGAPTHHSERALLSCWLLFVLTAAAWLSRIPVNKRQPMLIAVGAAVLLGGAIRHSEFFFDRQPMINRDEEESIGEAIKARQFESKVALATPDYGYFAVIAAAGKPERFSVLERHDPREHKLTGQAPLDAWLKDGGCVYVSENSPSGESAPKSDDSVLFSTSRLALRRALECR